MKEQGLKSEVLATLWKAAQAEAKAAAAMIIAQQKWEEAALATREAALVQKNATTAQREALDAWDKSQEGVAAACRKVRAAAKEEEEATHHCA